MEQIITQLHEWIILYGLRVLVAVLIVLVGKMIAKSARSLIRRLMNRAHAEDILVTFVSSLSYFVIMTFVLIAAVAQLGVQTASVIAVLGAASLAIGLSLQGSLSNFAAGVLMLIYKPFKLGDYIEGAGVAGVVQSMGIFTTELHSPDNKRIIVPNGKLTSDAIINYTANENRRVDLVATVSYSDNIGQAKLVLEEILRKEERILEEPEPVIGVLTLNNSSVDIAVRPWVRATDYWQVYFALQEQIKLQFDAHGITIPFPQRDIHVHQVTSAT